MTTVTSIVVHNHVPNVQYQKGCPACQLAKGSSGIVRASSLPHRYFTLFASGVFRESVDSEEECLRDAERLSQLASGSFSVYSMLDGEMVSLIAAYVGGYQTVAK